jgi:hypothetical protein
MSVNFFNSAGTDLDSLFYVNNGNAGGIGFINAFGQDLGNRYTNASTLGYAVGYKNSAGTDLGYLRGNAVPPQIQNNWANYIDRGSENFYLGKYDDAEVFFNATGKYFHSRAGNFCLNIGCDCTGTGQKYWECKICLITGGRAVVPFADGLAEKAGLCSYFAWWDNHSQVQKVTGWDGSSGHFENLSIGANSESGQFTVYKGLTDNHPARNIQVHFGANLPKDSTKSIDWSLGIRVYQRVWSNLGDTGWRRNDIWF